MADLDLDGNKDTAHRRCTRSTAARADGTQMIGFACFATTANTTRATLSCPARSTARWMRTVQPEVDRESREPLLTRYELRTLRGCMRRFLRAGSLPAPLSEKVVPAVAEPASAPTLQETEVSSLVETFNFNTTSLEESIAASPGTVPHNTIACQKFLAASAESDISSSEKLLDATSTEEAIIAIPGILPHNTVDGSSSFFPFSCEKLVEGIAESASVQIPQEPDALSSFHDSTSSEELITASPQAEPCDQKLVAAVVESASVSSKGPTTASPQSVLDNTTDSSPSSTSLGSKILIRRPRNWYHVFYIRMDRGGSFCMYPNLGGPFQSIDEADDAIDCYLDELRHRAGCKEQMKLSRVERLIHNCKYYPDGTPKKGPNSPKGNGKIYFVQALLHQYNENHNLFGTHALELEALVGHEWFYNDHRWYYHFNFTTKKNEVNDDSSTSNLFFAELSHMQGEQALEVNCCCMIKHDENGQCYGCRNSGSPDMKHPDNIGAYYGGQVDGYLPFGLEESSSSDDEEAEEERLRAKFKDLDDPKVWEKLMSLTRKIKLEV